MKKNQPNSFQNVFCNGALVGIFSAFEETWSLKSGILKYVGSQGKKGKRGLGILYSITEGCRMTTAVSRTHKTPTKVRQCNHQKMCLKQKQNMACVSFCYHGVVWASTAWYKFTKWNHKILYLVDNLSHNKYIYLCIKQLAISFIFD